MLTLDSAAAARLVSSVRGVAWLGVLEFSSGTLYRTTWPDDIEAVVGGSSQVFAGTGGHVTVDGVSESEDGRPSGVTISFPIVQQAMLAATIGNVENYRGKRITLYLQLIDAEGRNAGAPKERFHGFMQPVRVTRKRLPTGGSTGRIELPCMRAGIARSRNADGLRLSHAQQTARFPGDLGLQRLQSHVERPVPWLSAKFKEV